MTNDENILLKIMSGNPKKIIKNGILSQGGVLIDPKGDNEKSR